VELSTHSTQVNETVSHAGNGTAQCAEVTHGTHAPVGAQWRDPQSASDPHGPHASEPVWHTGVFPLQSVLVAHPVFVTVTGEPPGTIVAATSGGTL
jgi:hypothetical protein